MEVLSFETLLSIGAGLGLSAACGFRVFVPLLVMSIAALSGHLTLSSEFAWIATYPALIAFLVATILEIAGNAIPAVGATLNSLATPISMIAGTIATAACVTSMSPFLKWTLAIIAGGGAAGVVQGATIVFRLPAHAAAPGVADTGVSAGEAGGSFLLSILAIVVPLVALVAVFVGIIFILWFSKTLYTRWSSWRTASKKEKENNE